MKNSPIFYDTETVGLTGPVVLIQYAKGDGPVELHSVWKETIEDTMNLIEWIMYNSGGVVGFNLTFDHFQLQKIYNMFEMISDKTQLPEDIIEELAAIEAEARDGKCLKPIKACDLMLVARRGPYQSMMARKPMKVSRVPTLLAEDLASILEERVVLNEMYFARRKNKNLPKWEIQDCKRKDGTYDPEFKNIVMNFKASSALKVIANDILGADRFGRARSIFKDVAIDPKFYPAELGYAPFATALSKSSRGWKVSRNFVIKDLRGKYTWPALISHHIRHWHYGTYARQYAEDDVTDTRGIYEAFGSPELGDVDSELACMVGSVRWKGFSIDLEGVKGLRDTAINAAKLAPRAANAVREYLLPYMEPVERLGFKSTKKMILEEMVKTWAIDCPVCNAEDEAVKLCKSCNGTGISKHPVSAKAALVLKARSAKKDVEIYDKLLLAGRFHASFVIIGTLSSRMAGSDSFNAQAIRNDTKVRSVFTLHHPDTVLCGGDFEAFEVSLAEANYNDKKLREELQSYTECYKCGGMKADCDDCQGTNKTKMKIHALFGTICFPHMTYEQIVKDKIIYTRSKSGLFSQLYGGNYSTLMSRLGVDEKAAMAAEARFGTRYEGVARARQLIFDKFCSMRQPAGIGTHVEWHDPSDFIENMLDPPFRRYFILENQVTKILFDLANRPPAHWKRMKNVKVQRDLRDSTRVQTIGGAVQSALYGAAFQLQAANMRAAANHVIQSTGAEICKAVQRDIWTLQPCGVSEWLVMPMNIHDEIEAVIKNDPTLIESVKQVVLDKVETYRPLVPLIGMEWKTHMKSWGEK